MKKFMWLFLAVLMSVNLSGCMKTFNPDKTMEKLPEEKNRTYWGSDGQVEKNLNVNSIDSEFKLGQTVKYEKEDYILKEIDLSVTNNWTIRYGIWKDSGTLLWVSHEELSESVSSKENYAFRFAIGDYVDGPDGAGNILRLVVSQDGQSFKNSYGTSEKKTVREDSVVTWVPSNDLAASTRGAK